MKILFSWILFFVFFCFKLNAQVIPSFTYTFPHGHCAPNVDVVFTNTSSNLGSGTFWWNFDNGSPEYQSNDITRQINYNEARKYIVTLRCVDINGVSSKFTDTLVLVNSPRADFVADVENCIPTNVTFTNNSTLGDATIKEFKWNFGDGKYLYGEVQSKFLTQAASYPVYLNITDNNNCESVILKNISVYEKPDAGFSLNKNFSCVPPLTIQATPSVSNHIDAVYKWDFGNNNISGSKIPLPNTYNNLGSYTVSLGVYLGESCNDIKTEEVQVGPFPVTFSMFYGMESPQYIISPNQAVQKGLIIFRNTSNDTLEYKWNINGVEYVNTNPRVIFCEDGTYPVNLTIGTELDCPNTITTNLVIRNSGLNLIKMYQSNQLVLAEGNTGSVIFESPYIGVSNTWFFEDKVSNGNYSNYKLCEAGDYTIKLATNFEDKCVDTLTRIFRIIDLNDPNIIIRQNGVTNSDSIPQVCEGAITFSTASPVAATSKWNILDQEWISNLVNTVICQKGQIQVSVEGSFLNGCPMTSTKIVEINTCELDDYNLIYIVGDTKDEIEIFDQDTVCINETYRVDPQNPEHLIKWTFPTTKKSSVYYYIPEPGWKSLGMVTKKDNGCIDTIVKNVFFANVIADFSLKDPEFACAFPLETDFYNTSQYAQYFSWKVQYVTRGDTLVDSVFSTNKTPHLLANFQYKEQDEYRHWIDTTTVSITLKASSRYGCNDYKTIDIKKRMPLARFTPDINWGCAPLDVVFESQDEPGFDFSDSVFVFNPYTSEMDTVLQRQYNEIKFLYWDFGDGTPILQITESELRTMVDDIKSCYPDNDTAIERILREQKGYGIFHFINEYYKNNLPSAYEAFHACCRAKKTLSKRFQSHTYTQPGIYYPKLIVEDDNGCRDTSYAVEIRVGTSLSPDFMVTKKAVCQNEDVEIVYTGTGEDKIDSWHYSSNDLHINSFCSDAASPALKISPLKTGTFDITLRVDYNGCFSEITKKNAVRVKGPIGRYDYKILCASPYDYQFIGSIYEATNIEWNFGDSTSHVYDVYSPLHHFDTTGNYTVTLITSNDTTGCPDYIFSKIFKPRQVKADSLAMPFLCPKYGGDISMEEPEDFNTEKNFEPFAWYINDFAYRRSWTNSLNFLLKDTGTVELTIVAVDENLCTDTIRQNIKVRSPHVEIGLDKRILCGKYDTLNLKLLNFDSTITRWMWEFGDYTQAYQYAMDSVDSIQHDYTIKRDQKFYIEVWVQDSLGCVGRGIDSVQAYYHTAEFIMPSNTLCDVDTALFINKDQNLDSSYWDLGDTTFITQLSTVSHYYENFGVYPIIHVGYYKECKDSVYWKDSVGVGIPDARFTLSDDIVCSRQIYSLHVTNPLYDAEGLWTFEENAPDYDKDSVSFFYEKSTEYYRHYFPGTKRVTLKINYGSCSDYSYNFMQVNGASLKIENKNTCVDSIIRFEDEMKLSDSYEWKIFGQTTFDTVTIDPFLEHKFTDRGTYSMRLIALSDGCNDTIEKFNIIKIQKVKADYTISEDSICYNDEVVFTPSANIYDAESGEWWFTPYISTPFVKDTVFVQPYVTLGVNETKLILKSSNGCADTVRRNIYVGGTKPTIYANPEFICKGYPIQFSYSTPANATPPVALEWFFDDGGNSSDPSPTYTYYSNRGQYDVVLFYTDSLGCRVNSDYKTINVSRIDANFVFEKNPVCISEEIKATNKSSFASSNSWNLNNTYTSDDIDFVFTEGINQEGKYPVKLVVEDSKNCYDDTTLYITVVNNPAIDLIAKDSICLDSTVELTAIYADTLKTVRWYINGFPDFRQTNTRTDKPVETTEYAVYVEDEYGCNNADTALVYVQKYPNHEITLEDKIYDYFIESDTIHLIQDTTTIGDTVYVNVDSDVLSSYIWKTETTDISCTDCPNPSIYSFISQHYYLTVSDWCVTRKYDIFVDVIPTTKFDIPTAFTPNNDGKNDFMLIRGWGIKDILEFNIYNRWGQLVFSYAKTGEMMLTPYSGKQTNELHKRADVWDGTYNGKDQPVDTYTYTAKVLNYLNEELTKKGHFDLLR